MPMPLSASAAIVPATCVPWKLLWVSTVLSPLTKSQPCQSSTKPLQVVVDAVGLAAAAALARIAGELAGEVGVGDLDAGVDDGDDRARAAGRGPRPRARRCRRRRRPACPDRLAGVLQPEELAEVRVVGLQAHRHVRLGVDDVGVGVQRRERVLDVAVAGDDDLGVGQREHARERDVGVRAHRETLVAVQAGCALDDDRVGGDARSPAARRSRRAGRRAESSRRTHRAIDRVIEPRGATSRQFSVPRCRSCVP